MLDVTALLSDAGRSGVLKYSYAGTVSCSVVSQLGPVSKSNTVIVTIAARYTTRIKCNI